MLKKLFQKNNHSIFFALAILLLVFLFRFFLIQDFQKRDFLKIFIFYFANFFLLPYGVIRFFFQQKIADYFFKKSLLGEFKKNRKELYFFLFLIGFILLFMLKFNQWGNFPVSPWLLGRWELVLFLDFTFLPLILFFQEFFYRGFLLKIFSDKVDPWLAILFQAILAISFESFFGGRTIFIITFLFLFYLFLGWVSWKSRNFVFSWSLIFLSSLIFDLIVRYKIDKLIIR